MSFITRRFPANLQPRKERQLMKYEGAQKARALFHNVNEKGGKNQD